MNNSLKILIYLVIIVVEVRVGVAVVRLDRSSDRSFDVTGRQIRVRRDIETKVENENLFDVKSGVIVEEEKKEGEEEEDADDWETEATTRKKIKEVIVPGNDLMIGNCSEHDKMLYIDNTVINNDGPSVLNGTIEVS